MGDWNSITGEEDHINGIMGKYSLEGKNENVKNIIEFPRLETMCKSSRHLLPKKKNKAPMDLVVAGPQDKE